MAAFLSKIMIGQTTFLNLIIFLDRIRKRGKEGTHTEVLVLQYRAFKHVLKASDNNFSFLE